MNNIIVMYHYVRDNSNFKAFTTERFRKQVELFKNMGYRFITVKELIKKKPEDKTCCLTFDDGIKDGITNAFPIMDELNVVGTFFVPMRIFAIKELLDVQKVHLLLAKLGDEQFLKEFNDLVGTEFEVQLPSLDTNLSLTEVKYILYHMDKELHNFIINKMFDRYMDEQEEFDNIYLDKTDINELLSKDMEIGTHGFNHCLLGDTPYGEMKDEIQLSYGICKNLFQEPFSISYPKGSYNPLVERVLKSVGYKAGVTTLKHDNINPNLNPYELNRYDCIDIEISQ